MRSPSAADTAPVPTRDRSWSRANPPPARRRSKPRSPRRFSPAILSMSASAGFELPMPRRIIHCFRAPLGGVMRHVGDLVTAQHGMGLDLGLITASNDGGANADK